MSDVPEPIISAHGVHKSFGRTVALRGAGLALLHCLAGVLQPDSGVVSFRGTRLDSLATDERTRLRRISFGLVLQFGQLVPELTALENVALPLLLEGRRRSEAAAAATQWLERLEVGSLADARPTGMSGGESQRVAIARALVTSPDVVFADEPTGALDTVTGDLALDVLVKATRETQAALVLVTHDNRVAAVADREVVLRDGAVETRTDAPGDLGGGA